MAAVATTSAAPAREAPWWKHAVIYEIYPRSFADSNGNGVGDLRGITRKLPYLQRLGVDAIWIAPIYPSPQVDFGYDIADYRGVDPQFGTRADLGARPWLPVNADFATVNVASELTDTGRCCAGPCG